jgi:hypothetical protein
MRPAPRAVNADRACIVEHGDWCRGHEGVPHAWEWQADPEWRSRELRLGVTRWQHQRRLCFGCGKVRHEWRAHCRACGSPQRYYSERKSGVWRGRVHSWIQETGPFCLCPDHYDARATPRRRWSTADPAWADDPEQIAALGRRSA